MKRILKWGLVSLLVLIAGLAGLFIVNLGPGNFGRMVLGVGKSYDRTPPELSDRLGDDAVLIFSKTNGYRDEEQIVAANKALVDLARARGRGSVVTENGAIFNPGQLRRFKVVVWNSVSGDVLTADQRKALRDWLEAGGGFVALHGSGGDPDYAWKWYANELIGAQFIGHTMGPQFPEATLVVEDRDHPATRHLPARWTRSDEWYSFAKSPRDKGYRILVRIDESTYRPEMALLPFTSPRDIRMGKDHPMVWTHCVGKGRAFYSALGHRAASYAEPAHLKLIGGALDWAGGAGDPGCAAPGAD